MNLTLLEISDATEGQLVGIDPDTARKVQIGGVSTDTRTIGPGELFVAIRGDRFDGHDFVGQAEQQGASAALVEDRPSDSSKPGVLVPDSIVALGKLAAFCRARFAGPVIAITGSNGKTTTKEMCAAILTTAGIAVRRSPGNLNNHIGLPLSILGLEDEHRAMVVELGMNHPGEIDVLARIAQPTIGAITQVAPAHLGTVGSIQAIASAKGELLEHIDPKGCAILNADDANVLAQAPRSRAECVWFGIEAGADYRAIGSPHDLDHGRFRLEAPDFAVDVSLPMPGRYLVLDALCAVACAHRTGLLIDPAAAIPRALDGFESLPGRLKLCAASGGLRVLDDSYNANPASMRAALSSLLSLQQGGSSFAVLGDMLELGPDASALHQEIGRAAAEVGVNGLIAIGEFASETVRGARAAGLARAEEAEDAATAAGWIRDWSRPGDIVLIKGSRGSRMERVAHELENT